MEHDLRQLLKIPYDRLDDINSVLLNPDTKVVKISWRWSNKYGTPEEINRKAAEAGRLPKLIEQVKKKNPDYLDDLVWLQDQRDRRAFISVEDYRRRVLGEKR